MRMRMVFLILAVVLPAQEGVAQDWNLLAGDTVLDGGSIGQITDGSALTYFDDGVSRFSAGGAYSYTYANGGGTAFGSFRIGDEGQICIDFRNGMGRCDLYVRSGGRLVMLTQRGERFPVKIEIGVRD